MYTNSISGNQPRTHAVQRRRKQAALRARNSPNQPNRRGYRDIALRFGFVGALSRKFQPRVLEALAWAIKRAKCGAENAAAAFERRAKNLHCFRKVWASKTKVFMELPNTRVLIAEFPV